jgi:hypothetical protein
VQRFQPSGPIPGALVRRLHACVAGICKH